MKIHALDEIQDLSTQMTKEGSKPHLHHQVHMPESVSRLKLKAND